MVGPTRVDRIKAENGVLDQSKSNSWHPVSDMRAGCDGDAVPMRDDLHQRFPSEGQLLDPEVSGDLCETACCHP
jgi:hypothetical protein